MTRFLADENFPRPSVRRLRQAGLDVAIVETGSLDVAVLSRAVTEDRIILTFDLNFGQLALRFSPPPVPGVVLWRDFPANAEAPAKGLLEILAVGGRVLEGRITVLRGHQIRQRSLGPSQ